MDRDEERLIRRVRCILFSVFLILPTIVFSSVSGAVFTTVNAPALANSFIQIQSTVLNKAISLYHFGDFRASYQLLLTLSENDNPKAFFLLGKMYERGDGVTRDESKAIIYYQKSVELGFDEALQRIDQLLDGETSVVLDWYLESAWDGDIESVFNLGYLYESGMGVRIDESLALQWYEEAASQQHADAQLRLGLMLIAGAGLDIDVNSGKKWILKAGKNGNKIAQTIDVLLIQNNKNLDIVKAMRGLRTLEHSDEAKILQVLMSSVAQMAQPLSLSLLSEKTARLLDKKPVVSLNDIESKGFSIENEVASFDQWLIDSSKKEEGSLLYWVLLSIVLTSVFTTLFHYFIHKRSRKPKWERRSQLVLPEFKVNSSDKEFMRKLWEQENKTHLSVNVPQQAESITVPIVESIIEPIDVESKIKISEVSVDKLVSEYKFDLQVFKHDISFEREIPEKNTILVQPEDVVSSAVNEDVDDVNEKELRSYMTEQAREYEASQINDIDTVSEARLNIGLMFFRGDGVVKNIPLAIKWLKLSETQGNQDAESELKQLYVDYPEYIEIEEGIDEQRVSA